MFKQTCYFLARRTHFYPLLCAGMNLNRFSQGINLIQLICKLELLNVKVKNQSCHKNVKFGSAVQVCYKCCNFGCHLLLTIHILVLVV